MYINIIIIIMLIVSTTQIMDFLVDYYNSNPFSTSTQFFDSFVTITSKIIQIFTFHDNSIYI